MNKSSLRFFETIVSLFSRIFHRQFDDVRSLKVEEEIGLDQDILMVSEESFTKQ